MKTFIRSLNIEERKTFIYAVSHTIFKTLSSLLIKIMSENFKTGSLTILCERGCMLSIICFFRILFLIRNNKSKREEILNTKNYKNVLLKGIISCLSFSFMVISLYHVSMSTYFTIIRLSPLLTMFISQTFFNEEMKKYQVICSLVDMVGVSFVLIPNLFNENEYNEPIGLGCCLIVMIMLSFSDILSNKMKRTNVDLLIFFTGIYSACLGSFLMITLLEGIEEINIFNWILIFLNAIFTYYAILFQTKAIKKASKSQLGLFPFTLFSILITLFFGVIFFEQKISSNDTIALIILIINTIFYFYKNTSNVKKSRELEEYTFYSQ